MNISISKCLDYFSFFPQILGVSVVCEDVVHKSKSGSECFIGRTNLSSSFDLISVMAGVNPGVVELNISNDS